VRAAPDYASALRFVSYQKLTHSLRHPPKGPKRESLNRSRASSTAHVESKSGGSGLESSNMALPNITIHVSGTAIAIYGAVLSTITGAAQIITHFRDRAHLRIRVQPNMQIMGDPRYANMTLTIMYVVNTGRRPVTITSVGAYRLCPHDPFIVSDTIPACPCEITEGKQLTAIINQSDLDLSLIESWEAYTSADRTYRLSVIPWYRRRWNRRQLRKHYSRKKA